MYKKHYQAEEYFRHIPIGCLESRTRNGFIMSSRTWRRDAKLTELLNGNFITTASLPPLSWKIIALYAYFPSSQWLMDVNSGAFHLALDGWVAR